MSPTRLYIILFALAIGLLALFARAVQIQVVQKETWEEKVRERNIDVQRQHTTRGRVLDVKGREMAVNAACIDAVVDYRVITRPADDEWIRKYARARLVRTLGSSFENAPYEQRKALLDEQILQVHADIEQMWNDLGNPQITGSTPEQIEERRQQTVRKVQMLRRSVWYSRYVKAEKEQEPPAWWYRWLTDDQGVDLDTYDVTVSEQTESHVILPAISSELANHLGKNMDRYPGLSLQPGEHRIYPMKDVASHVLGYIGPVSGEDIAADPNRKDPLRRYLPTEDVGRSGVESLCEQLLRGSRGRIRRDRTTDKAIESTPAQPGQDVRLTIDAELQRKIEVAFASRVMEDKGGPYLDTHPFYGAAVVIDVPTNEVRALVTYPTYDINELDKTYAAMVKDEINHKLLNRATQALREPGSTVKPALGIAGVTERVVGIHEGIECTGRLVLSGSTFNSGKCWPVSLTHDTSLHAHHVIPIPHKGKYGNQDGWLAFEDALERSCNIWCEQVADRLGSRLPDWYDRFGLGRPTGIGLPEVSGRIPRSNVGPLARQRMQMCFAGIGQGDMLATPIQVANMIATIARDGVWMRPKLVGGDFAPPGVTGPEQVKLPVDPEAVRAAKRGMIAAVNSPAGTGTSIQQSDIAVAGKTGTAQAARVVIPVRDEKGEVVMEKGKKKLQELKLSTRLDPNPLAPWYRGSGKEEDKVAHAWFVGFVPADRPKLAFAAMVEYGGSGGSAAGAIAKALLEAAREEGYLPPAAVKP